MFHIDSSSKEAIANSFFNIARNLFNDFVIQVNSNFYRFVEIEFYYHDEKRDHTDVFSHKNKHQLTTGYLYAHGSGVDITIGSGGIYGGILIRSIEKIKPVTQGSKLAENVFIGPHLVLTELFSGFNSLVNGEPNIIRLVSPRSESISLQTMSDKQIINTKRINLNSARDVDGIFHSASYRYLIYPHLKHKNKQDIADQLAEEWGTDSKTLDEIKALLGSEFLKKYRIK